MPFPALRWSSYFFYNGLFRWALQKKIPGGGGIPSPTVWGFFIRKCFLPHFCFFCKALSSSDADYHSLSASQEELFPYLEIEH
jgi:hypothetical protein